jgi:hypothetical protein
MNARIANSVNGVLIRDAVSALIRGGTTENPTLKPDDEYKGVNLTELHRTHDSSIFSINYQLEFTHFNRLCQLLITGRKRYLATFKFPFLLF